MPFADDRCLIAGLMKQLGHRDLRAVKSTIVIVVKTIEVAVFPGQHAGAGRAAKRIGRQAAREAHALPGQTIDIRRLVEAKAISADGLIGMIVAENEYNVWARRGRLRNADAVEQA